jgi:hypothetical protein
MNDQQAGPLTTAAAEWSEVERLFGVRGEPSRCWCRYLALTGPEYSALDPAGRKAQLKEKFDGVSPSPGVLAFRGGVPVGWCAVEPRRCYPRVLRSQVLRQAEPSALAQTRAAESGAAEAGTPGEVWSSPALLSPRATAAAAWQPPCCRPPSGMRGFMVRRWWKATRWTPPCGPRRGRRTCITAP